MNNIFLHRAASQISRKRIADHLKFIMTKHGIEQKLMLREIVDLGGPAFDRRYVGRIRKGLRWESLRWFIIWIEKYDPSFLRRLSDILLALQPLAVQPPWISIARDIPLGFGAPPVARPMVQLGTRQRLVVQMPFSGYLSMFNVDGEFESPQGQTLHWLDPLLGVVDQRLSAEQLLVPSIDKEGILIGGEPGRSTLVAVASIRKLVHPWRQGDAPMSAVALNDNDIVKYLEHIVARENVCSVATLSYQVVI